MEYHKSLSDSEFESQFENCKIVPGDFTHEAHLRLAWIHIQRYGVDLAIGNITSQLLSFVTFLGARDKYNETVTVAAIKTMAHFINRSQSDSFIELMLEFPRMKNNFKELLEAHYSFDLFNNVEAKERFLEPDLLSYD